jgi:alkanesulfonate monooxygenase SsuD/methylene tetrahydromethanopterin reductase-like flavin-dependent oxidoreductase (luciferase family)
MRFGLEVPNFGEFADVRALAELAEAAEHGGWDGFFLWDHIAPSFVPGEGLPTADVTVALTAIALATERIRFGALVTPLARRRPHKVSRELVSLDQVSSGRLVLGVGLGSPPDTEFAAFGEEADDRHRAAVLDESLEVMTRFWRGEAVDFDGRHLHVHTAPFLPVPLQQPRIPIWVAATWPGSPGPLRRARRWDGIVPISSDLSGETFLTPADIEDIRKQLNPPPGFDVVVTPPRGANPEEYQAAGATWWLEVPWTLEAALAMAKAGPVGQETITG